MSRPAPIRKPYIKQVRATRPSMKMTNNPGPFVNLPWYKFTFEKELITVGDNQDVPVNKLTTLSMPVSPKPIP